MLLASGRNSWVVENYRSYAGVVMQTWSPLKNPGTVTVGTQTDEQDSFEEVLRDREFTSYWDAAGEGSKSLSPVSEVEVEWQASKRSAEIIEI